LLLGGGAVNWIGLRGEPDAVRQRREEDETAAAGASVG
jgi:hypothetical protein